MNNERRELFTPNTMQVREAEAGKPLTIEGCAIVFNKETVLYDSQYYREREIILPSCVTDEFLKTQDVKLNLLHKRSKSLARKTKDGEGTLHMEIREDGLYFSVELPDCDLGKQAYELVKNRTYTGCSFEFIPGESDKTVIPIGQYGEDVLYTRKTFRELSALTIAMDPAYSDTEVAAREAREAELREKAECKKHEDDKPEDETNPDNPETPEQQENPDDEAANQAECKKREYAKTKLQANLILCDEDYQ